MIEKKVADILKETIEKLNKNVQTGAVAGRIVPVPTSSLKPKVIVKPEDKKD
ncbi:MULTISPECIES: hypothetical protein [Flavobacterium]|jgi:hypothetical protein|uniref:hypothetical protein n=1 Tax=Flavobacterium TaxID=237 RepID=UPI000AB05E24|nr:MULTISPECIES: hypothetical protein [Flavobacterium]MDL2142771.1 hypothetical protein [Flavobacterium tructae]UWY27634.1 hypothetical protein N4T20_18115 [Flavobacterium sp. TR2]